jgi:hypothetical protein
MGNWSKRADVRTAGKASLQHLQAPTCRFLFTRATGGVGQTIRTAMGIRSDSPDLDDPSVGFVWTAIVRQLDNPEYLDNYVSIADTPRERFSKHPWTLAGGGAAELKEMLDTAGAVKLGDLADAIGFAAIIAEDNAFLYPKGNHLLSKLPQDLKRPFVHGELVRD